MNIKNIFELSWINFKTNKFKNRTYILIFTIIMTLIICVFSGKNSLMKFNDDYRNSDYHYRTIGVATDNYNNAELKETLENMNIEHVTAVFKDNDSFYQIVKYEVGGSIELYGNYEGINYTLNSGRDIQNDNEIICPSTMYPGNWTLVHDKSQYIDMTQKIGEKININYNKLYIIDEDTEEILNTYEYQLELVGTYDVSEDLTAYDICYVSTNFFEKVSEEKEPVRADKNYIDIYEYEVYVLVDEYKNVDSVMKTLSDAGYELQLYYELDLDFFDEIVALIDKVSIYVLAATAICVCLFINNTLQENKKNIALYELLGYEKKNIQLIYFCHYLINTIISFIISVIVAHLIKFGVMYVFSLDPNFSFLNIYIFYKEIIIYLLFIILIIFISVIALFKLKYKKFSPIKLMEDKL